jgi:predicted nucleic acid-binding protein
MKVVLDASAAIAAVLGREPAPAILEIVDRASIVIAPEMFVPEVTSGLWKYVIAGQLSIDNAIHQLQRAVKLVGSHTVAADLAPEVLREAETRRHSVYDLFYVVLARREGAAVITLDRRLRKLVEEMGVLVHP